MKDEIAGDLKSTVAAEEAAVSGFAELSAAEMKETQAFLANLGAQCAEKKKEWAERQSMRAEKVLAAEQKEDDDTKAFCSTEIEKAEGEKSDTEEGIAASTAAIEEMEESSATLASEIETLGKEIKALDKAVTEATEQRKEEHEDFITFQT